MADEKKGKKDSSHTHHYVRQEKERRRGEAAKRQTIYDGLSPAAKIAVCQSRRGKSEKELKRIEIAAKTS